MSEILQTIAHIVICAVALKAMLIGSDFNFYYWWKYGRKYLNWYDNRPKFPVPRG